MPNWRFHMGFGFVVAVILLIFYFSFGYLEVYKPPLTAFITGVFAWILGSDIPDFDSRKTRIKHILGLLLGGFISIFFLVHVHLDIKPIQDLLIDWELFFGGYLLVAFGLFVIFVLLNTLIWFFPLKHRGRAHSLVAGLIYGIFWMLVSYSVFWFGLVDSLFVGACGLGGIFIHLILDREVKIWA